MQRVDFLVEDNKGGSTSQALEDTKTREISVGIESQEPQLQGGGKQFLSDRLEFFTGLAWCQGLILKSWMEASDKLIKLQAEKGTKEIPSLYVDVHEEVFTNLFKSQLFASNLGRMVNASMMILKNWQNPTQLPILKDAEETR